MRSSFLGARDSSLYGFVSVCLAIIIALPTCPVFALAFPSYTNDQSAEIAALNTALLRLLEAERNKRWREIAKLRYEIKQAAAKAREAGRFDLQEAAIFPIGDHLIVAYQIDHAAVAFRLQDSANPLGESKTFRISIHSKVTAPLLANNTRWFKTSEIKTLSLLSNVPQIGQTRVRSLADLAVVCSAILKQTSILQKILQGHEPQNLSNARLEAYHEATKLLRAVGKDAAGLDVLIEELQREVAKKAASSNGAKKKKPYQPDTSEVQERIQLLQRNLGTLEFAMERLRTRELPESVRDLFRQNSDPDHWVSRGYVFLLDSQGNYLDAHKGNDFRDKVMQWQKEMGLVWVYGLRCHNGNVQDVRHMQDLNLNRKFKDAEVVAVGYAPGVRDRLYPIYAMDTLSFQRYRADYAVSVTSSKSFLDFREKFPDSLTQELSRYSIRHPNGKQLVLQVGLRKAGRVRHVLEEAISWDPALKGEPLILDVRLNSQGSLNTFGQDTVRVVDSVWKRQWVRAAINPETFFPTQAVLRGNNGKDVREAHNIYTIDQDGNQNPVDFFFKGMPDLATLSEYLQSEDIAAVRVEGINVPKSQNSFWAVGGILSSPTQFSPGEATVSWVERQGNLLRIRTKLLSARDEPVAPQEERLVPWPAQRVSRKVTDAISDEQLRATMLSEGFTDSDVDAILKTFTVQLLVLPEIRRLLKRLMGRVSMNSALKMLSLLNPAPAVTALELLMDQHRVPAITARRLAMDSAIAEYTPEDITLLGRLISMEDDRELPVLNKREKHDLADLCTRHPRVIQYDPSEDVVHLKCYSQQDRAHKLNLNPQFRLAPMALTSTDIERIEKDIASIDLANPKLSTYQFYDGRGNLLAYHRGDMDERFDVLLEYLLRRHGRIAVAGVYKGDGFAYLNNSAHCPKGLSLEGVAFPDAGEMTILFEKAYLGKSVVRTALMNQDFYSFLKVRGQGLTLKEYLDQNVQAFPRYVPRDVFVKTPAGDRVIHTMNRTFRQLKTFMRVLKDAAGLPLHVPLRGKRQITDFSFFSTQKIQKRYVLPWERRDTPAKQLRWEITFCQNGLESRFARTNADGSEVLYVFNVELPSGVTQGNALFSGRKTSLVKKIKRINGGRIHLPTSKEYVVLINAMAKAQILTPRQAEAAKHWWRDRVRSGKPVSEMTEVEKQFARRTSPTGAHEIFILGENGKPLPDGHHAGTNLDPLIGKIQEALKDHPFIYIYGIKLTSTGLLKRPLLHAQSYHLITHDFRPDQRVVHQVQNGAAKEIDEILPVCTIGQAQFDTYLADRKPGETLAQFLKRRPLKPYARYHHTRMGSDQGPAAAAHLEEIPRGETLWEALRESHPGPISIEHYRRTSGGRMNLMPQSAYAIRRLGPTTFPVIWTNARMQILKDGVLTQIFPMRGKQVLLAQYFVPLGDILTKGNTLFAKATLSSRAIPRDQGKFFLPDEKEMPKILADLARFKILDAGLVKVYLTSKGWASPKSVTPPASLEAAA